MKLTIRTIKGETFSVEQEGDNTVIMHIINDLNYVIISWEFNKLFFHNMDKFYFNFPHFFNSILIEITLCSILIYI